MNVFLKNKDYRRFSIAFVLTGILLIVICNIYMIGTNGEDNSRQYLVDIKRAADEIKEQGRM